jgi:hypothetical protein
MLNHKGRREISKTKNYGGNIFFECRLVVKLMVKNIF